MYVQLFGQSGFRMGCPHAAVLICIVVRQNGRPVCPEPYSKMSIPRSICSEHALDKQSLIRPEHTLGVHVFMVSRMLTFGKKVVVEEVALTTFSLELKNM